MTARSALTVVGQAVGAYFGGSWGAAIGGAIGGLIGGAIDGPVRNTQALLDDLGALKFDYGSAWPRMYGRYRFKISPMWSSTKRPVEHEEEIDEKGGPAAVNTSFTYEQDWMCWAPLGATGFARVWRNGELIYSVIAGSPASSVAASMETPAWASITFFDGDAAQMPWTVYEASVGTDNAVAFRHRPSLCIGSLDLGPSGQPPLIEVEFYTAATADSETHAIVYAPFVASDADTIAPACPVSLDNPLETTFDIDNGMQFTPVLSNCNAIYGTTGVPTEVSPAGYLGEQLSFRVHVDAVNVGIGGGTANAQRFFMYSNGGEEVSMSMRTVGGVPKLMTNVYHGVGSDEITYGDLPTPATYWIVFNADDTTVSFYVKHDDDEERSLVRTVAMGKIAYGRAILSLPVPSNGSGIPSVMFKDFYVYTGDEPVDVVTYTPLPVSLADIVQAEALLEWSGEEGALTEDDINVTALAAIDVTGFATTGSPRESIAQLMDWYYFGCRCSSVLDFTLRGGASIDTVAFDHTGVAVGQPGEPFTGVARGNDLEVAIQIAVTSPNVLTDYDPGTESSDRLVGESVELRRYTSPIVATPAERKGRADTMVYDGRVASNTGRISLDDRHVEKEPFDVWLQYDDQGTIYRVRSDRMTYADGVHEHEVSLDDPSVLSTVGITTETDSRAVTVLAPPDTVVVPLDIPNIEGAEIARGIYAAAKPVTAAGWTGWSYLQSSDDVTFAKLAGGTKATVIGSCSAVPAGTVMTRVFNEFDSIVVDVGTGTLSSSTRDAIIADNTVNAFAIGAHGRWLLGQFRDRELLSSSPNVYKLTGLLLGSLGTEQYIGTQVGGDRFVLLKPTGGVIRVPQALIDQGALRYYKGVSIGKSSDAVASASITQQEVGLMPLSPWDVRIARDASGNATITWQRRTRFSTRFTGPSAPIFPLGEERESYAIDVFTDNTYGTVMRTLAASSPSVAYSATDQVTDFGGAQPTLYVKVHQLSAAVGRGFAAQKAA